MQFLFVSYNPKRGGKTDSEDELLAIQAWAWIPSVMAKEAPFLC